MTYIIAEPCVDVKDKACVDVCPVDCIYGSDVEEDRMLYINPNECIDCAACEPVCPVTAIFAEDDVPQQWKKWTPINYEYFDNAEATRVKVNEMKPAGTAAHH
ncbi:MAG: ferredoxin family protein [Chloroflexi bacterium]|nr:ferredoxin family protein [Chloroflexota bacterium]